MRISCVVNTCALGPHAHEVTGSTTPTPHAFRAYALQHFVLSAYVASPWISEVIVVGEYREGDGYIYVEAPSRHFSAVDALHQRQAGFEASSGDIVIHVHDDHLLDVSRLEDFSWWESDVWAFPRRRHGVSGVETHPNGFPDYISGHAAAYRREVLEKCPWGDVPKVHTWDVEHTRQIRDAGFRISEASSPLVWDVEFQT